MEVKIETYKERYEQLVKAEEEFFEAALNEVAWLFKTIQMRPINIGNMVYYYCKHNGKEVPAYCYKSDYEEGKGFMPIYDRLGYQEFGWSDKNEVVKILDVIRNKIYEEIKS